MHRISPDLARNGGGSGAIDKPGGVLQRFLRIVWIFSIRLYYRLPLIHNIIMPQMFDHAKAD